jgi:predicted transglutaminase-like cysteine proteinase
MTRVARSLFDGIRRIGGFASNLPKLGLAMSVVMGLATPSFAIDARRATVGLLPTKAVVSAPQGASNLCDAYEWACAKGERQMVIDKAAMDLLNQINRKANRSVQSVSDQQQYRVAERWSLPTKRGGDCEDFVLYKKVELMRAGFSADQLLIATVLDRKGGSHAVLVFRTGKQDLVLDNLTSTIKPWQKTGYTFLRLQNPEDPSQWVAVFAGGMFDKTS